MSNGRLKRIFDTEIGGALEVFSSRWSKDTNRMETLPKRTLSNPVYSIQCVRASFHHFFYSRTHTIKASIRIWREHYHNEKELFTAQHRFCRDKDRRCYSPACHVKSNAMPLVCHHTQHSADFQSESLFYHHTADIHFPPKKAKYLIDSHFDLFPNQRIQYQTPR